MKSDATEIGSRRSVSAHGVRRARPPKPKAHPGVDAKPNRPASPAAMDEVFARLAHNVERMQRSHARVRVAETRNLAEEMPAAAPTAATPTHIGTIPGAPRPPESTHIDSSALRSLDAEMDRQRERLAQLLREIDGATAAD